MKKFLVIIFFTGIALLFIGENKREQNIDPSSYIVNKITLCAQEKIPKSCLQKASVDFLNHFSLEKIQEVLKKHMDKEAIFLNCHETLHYIGLESYKRTENISTVLTFCTDLCINGCYHGAFEGYFIANKLYQEKNVDVDKMLEKVIQEFCKPETNTKAVTCIHGAGHGLVFITNGDIPRSLAICQVLQTAQNRESCYAGVLMENVIMNNGHPSSYFRPDDPLYTCKVLPLQYQSICYTYAGINFIPFTTNKLTDADWEKSIALCRSVPLEYQTGCFSTMGTLQTGLVLSQDLMRKNCKRIDEETNRYACMYGTITHLYKDPNPAVVDNKLREWMNE